MNKLFIIAVLALTMVLAPTVSFATSNNNNNGDDDNDDSIIKDKAKKCQVKVQVKLFGTINGTIYVVELDDLAPQAKQAIYNQSEFESGDNNMAFMFQFKKNDSCPEKGDIIEGSVDEVPFAAVINYLTKVNKIGIDMDVDQ
jgi:hypothetical protein